MLLSLTTLALLPALSGSLQDLPGTFACETRDGTRVEGKLLRLDRDEVVLEQATGTLRVPLRDVVLVQAEGQPAAPAETDMPRDLVVLADENGAGDRLWGWVVGGDEFGIEFALDGGQVVTIALDHVDRLLPQVDRPVDRLLDLEGGGFDDRVWRRREDGTLDGVTGVLARVDTKSVALDSGLGELSFQLGDVLAVVLSATEPPDGELQGIPVRVRLAGGSLFDAGLLGGDVDRLRLSTAFAEDLTVPLGALSALLLLPESAALLADTEPVDVSEWSSLAGDDAVLFPWRRDLSVSGGPLRLAGVLAASGLGVHANARMVYEVPEGVSVLRITVGLVDEVLALPAQASVTFEILVDGESRVATGVVREGEAPRTLRVEGLTAGQRLELLTGDAGDHDAGDRVAWVDGVFLP